MLKLLKKIILPVAAVTICFGQAACDMVADVTMPDSYYIEYEVTNDDNTVSVIAKGVDQNGNCYYGNGLEEFLFIKNGTRYESYVKEEGGWSVDGVPVNREYIDSSTKEFDDLARKGVEFFGGSFKENGSREFFGKDCTVYEHSISVTDMFITRFEMLSDKETNICLSYYSYSIVNGKESRGTGYECVVYKTEGVDFSAYISK